MLSSMNLSPHMEMPFFRQLHILDLESIQNADIKSESSADRKQKMLAKLKTISQKNKDEQVHMRQSIKICLNRNRS
jgi:hypothetical protein